MKIIQITDTHLMSRGTELHGLNPCIRLEACVANINENHSDAEMCIITGDLTERGDIGAYQDFYEIIGRLSIPCHPLIGNHDHREKFCKIFPNVPRDEHGLIQWKMEQTGVHFVKSVVIGSGMNWINPGMNLFTCSCTILLLRSAFLSWMTLTYVMTHCEYTKS